MVEGVRLYRRRRRNHAKSRQSLAWNKTGETEAVRLEKYESETEFGAK